MQVRQAEQDASVGMGGEHAEERAHDGRPVEGDCLCAQLA
jgi:hypothetical protein